MKLTPMHIKALKYVESGEYRMIGERKAHFRPLVHQLRESGYLTVKFCGNCSKLVLTYKATCFMASLR
jgi:hypothetical protein